MELSREQFEVAAIARDDGRAVMTRREGDQRIVLKLTPFRDLPIVRVTDGANELASPPPIVLGRSPLDSRNPVED